HCDAHRRDEKERLECIGVYDCLDASFDGVQPDKDKSCSDSNEEGNTPGVEQKKLQYGGGKIQPQGRAERAGYQEEKRSRLVRPEVESLFEVCVNGNQVQPVIQRHENADDHPVAQQVTQHDLEVSEA